MALLTCVLTIAALAGCEPDRVVASGVLDTNRISAVVYPESVSVVNLCGPRMSIRNANDDSVVAQYAPTGDGARTTITLPKRPAGTSFSETYIIMSGTSGKIVVWVGTRRTDTPYPAATCPPRPEVPVAAPLAVDAAAYAAREGLMVTDTRYSYAPYSRTRLLLKFRPGTSRLVRQALLDVVGGTVLGGLMHDGANEAYYYVDISAPSDSGLLPMMRAIGRLKQNAAVERASPEAIKSWSGSGVAANDGGDFATCDLCKLRSHKAQLVSRCHPGPVGVGVCNRRFSDGSCVG